MLKWDLVLREYEAYERANPARFGVMRQIVTRISNSAWHDKAFPSMSHELLLLVVGRPLREVYPVVSFCPESTGTTFEIEAYADLGNRLKNWRVPAAEAEGLILKLLDQCRELSSSRNGRDFWLLCDIRECLIEIKYGEQQLKYMCFDDQGNVKAKGVTGRQEFKSDLFVFSMGLEEINYLISHIPLSLLGRSGKYMRTGEGAQPTTIVSIAFQLRDNIETQIEFGTASATPSLPEEVHNFCSIVEHAIRELVDKQIELISP